MRSVWIVEQPDGQPIANYGAAVKKLADDLAYSCGKDENGKAYHARRYVPASELAKVRKERDEWIAKTKTALWCDSRELKDALRENRRLRKAVDWAVNQKKILAPKDQDQIAIMAGLRHAEKARRWVKK